jgi:ABC-type methionine transport system permease subunit
MFFIGLFLITLMGSVIEEKITLFEADNKDPDGIDPENLCSSVLFQLFRNFPFVIILVMFIAYKQIKNTLDSTDRNTNKQ